MGPIQGKHKHVMLEIQSTITQQKSNTAMVDSHFITSVACFTLLLPNYIYIPQLLITHIDDI